MRFSELSQDFPGDVRGGTVDIIEPATCERLLCGRHRRPTRAAE
jgi:hypothetical protein